MIDELTLILPLVVATILGALIGVERELSSKPAGLRTNALVCMGAALIVTVAANLVDPSASGRAIAGVITGVGFLGAGAILHLRDHIEGLTTAASIWVVAAIGVAAGLGYYLFAAVTTLLVLVILESERLISRKKSFESTTK